METKEKTYERLKIPNSSKIHQKWVHYDLAVGTYEGEPKLTGSLASQAALF